ncbi:MAG TPA: UDP-3-O-(3-hydroxymyristoyl)glucosamine N-acyltransferase [Granulicella sp.]|jgi:UDP-3-O-[3-hydroxymyristoyl] glucosamine N-acyltransferase|nr:UDP-3-O-(3-hydroxymyristoyl)glucosamine N-acyltransferase [Granulicella sp.]
MRLAELAEHLGAELKGDPAAEITDVAGIEEAGPGQVTFVDNPKYAGFARTTRAAAVLVKPDFPEIAAATLRLANPYLGFARAIEVFYQSPVYAPGVHPMAVIDPTAVIGANVHVGAYVVISAGVVIGDDAVLLPHVVIYPHARIGDRFFAHAHAVVREHCRLGDDVMLQNGAIVGADGFGFARQHGAGLEGKAWYKIVQSGKAVLEDRVEVQANACIDRASIGETRIHAGAKIDNLVQVGHGSEVGEDTLLCSQVGLAGSSHIGRNVILAGQVGVAGHCRIGDGVIATAQSGIPSDVEAGKMVSGYPAIENRQWLRSVAVFNRLPEMLRRLRSNPE